MKKFKIGDMVILKPGKHKLSYGQYDKNTSFIITREWITGNTGGGWCYAKTDTHSGVFQCDLLLGKIKNWRARLEQC